jgi:hypothetical protein
MMAPYNPLSGVESQGPVTAELFGGRDPYNISQLVVKWKSGYSGMFLPGADYFKKKTKRALEFHTYTGLLAERDDKASM